jgi:hypothetical protein
VLFELGFQMVYVFGCKKKNIFLYFGGPRAENFWGTENVGMRCGEIKLCVIKSFGLFWALISYTHCVFLVWVEKTCGNPVTEATENFRCVVELTTHFLQLQIFVTFL